MKRCPSCNRTYTDDSLNFCLDDGATLRPLSAASGPSQEATLSFSDAPESGGGPPPTEILDPALAPTVRASRPGPTVPQQSPRVTSSERPSPDAYPSTGPKRQRTGVTVALTAIATVLVLAVAGVGAWLLLKDKKDADGDTVSVNRNGQTGREGGNTGVTPANDNSARPKASPNVTASPSTLPGPSPASSPAVDPAAARREVLKALDGWTETMREGDLDAHMAYYADVLHTYYLQSNYSKSKVSALVAKAFSKYSSFDVKLTNINVEIDSSGQHAVATFDKTFEFTGETSFSGSGLNRFWLEKIGGVWLITGEKDLKTYYVNKE
jgi:ketosteroid isomerase-like protein